MADTKYYLCDDTSFNSTPTIRSHFKCTHPKIFKDYEFECGSL